MEINLYHYNEEKSYSNPRQSYQFSDNLSSSPFFTEKIAPENQGYIDNHKSSRRARLIVIFSGVGAALSIFSALLLWLLFYRNGNLWMFAMSIITTLIGVLAVGAAIAGKRIAHNLSLNETEDSFLTSATSALSSIAAAFYIIGALFLILFRPFQYGGVLCAKSETSTWRGYFDSWSAKEGWDNDKLLLTICTCVFLASSAMFGMVVFIIWSISKYLIDIARSLYSIAGIGVILFGMLSIWQIIKVRLLNEITAYKQEIFNDKLLASLYWIMIIVVLFMIFCLIVNVFRKRSIYFIISFILMIVAIVIVIMTALCLRELKRSIDPRRVDQERCSYSLEIQHEDVISRYCPRKYLNEGTSCGTENRALYWEKDYTLRYVSPSACLAAHVYFHWDAFLMGYYLFMTIAFLCIVIANCFFLSDTSEFLGTYYEGNNPIAVICLVVGLCLLFLGLLTLNFIWPTIDGKVNPWLIKQVQADKGLDPDLDFKIVPEAIWNTPTSDGCFSYSSEHFPIIEQHTCRTEGCGFRVIMLARNGIFKGEENISKDVVGDVKTRSVFFPNNQNSDDAYLLLKGSAKDINNALASLRYCPVSIFDDINLFMNIQELELRKMDNFGMIAGESSASFKIPSPTGERGADPIAYDSQKDCVQKECKIKSVFKISSNNVRVQGRLAVMDINRQIVPMNNAEDMIVEFKHNGRNAAVGDISVNPKTGEISFEVESLTEGGYTGQLSIIDKKSNYLQNTLDILVPHYSSPIISFGNLMMVTPDGSGCQGGSADCFSKITLKQGTLKVDLIDAFTNLPIPSCTVMIYTSFSTTSDPFQSSTTSPTFPSSLIFSALPLGPYLLSTTSLSCPSHLPTSQRLYLLSPLPISQQLYLSPPAPEGSALTAMLSLESGSSEVDLFVQVRSLTGKTCRVAPFNKYCAFVEHAHGVDRQQSGKEVVWVREASVAEYLVYAGKDVAQGPQGQDSQAVCKGEGMHRVLEWEEVKERREHLGGQTRTGEYWTIYCFNGFGSRSIRYVNYRGSEEPKVENVCKGMWTEENGKYSLENLEKEVAKHALIKPVS